MKSLSPTICLAALLLVAGCVRSVPGHRPTAGQVLEAGSHAPIAGAIVIARWQTRYSTLGGSEDFCVHAESTMTDAEGRYVLREWRWRKPYMVDAFKPGYSLSHEYFKTHSYRQGIVLLEPFRGSPEERVKALEGLRSAFYCVGGGRSLRNLYPLYEALYNEAKSLHATATELWQFRWVAARFGTAENGDMNAEEADKRKQEFLREHLK